jgi:hypothetical protein
MNFDIFADYVLSFYSQYPFMVGAFAIALLFMVYKKPKESFKLALLLLFMAAVFYALGLLQETLSTGTQSTNEGIQRSRALDN